jgi:hypothetical protein
MYISHLKHLFNALLISTILMSAAFAAQMEDEQTASNYIPTRVELDEIRNGEADFALYCAAENGQQGIVTYLLTNRDIPESLRPTRNALHLALCGAAENGHQGIVTYLLTSPDMPESLRPTQDGIDIAYHEAVSRTRQNIIVLLEPRVSAAERQNQQRGNAAGNGRGFGWEIHDYVDTNVHVQSGDSPTAVPLGTAIMNNIEQRVGSQTLPTQPEMIDRLHAWIDGRYLNATENTLAKDAIQYGWNDNTPRRLALVFAFLNQHHSNSFDAWMAGFIGESIEAYKGRNKPESCNKGIDERIVTGLRGIDAELDKIFAPAERNKMIKDFFGKLNVGETAGATRVANALMERGVTTTSTPEQVASAYRMFLIEQIKSHGGDTDGEYAERIAEEIRVLDEGGYDRFVKPQIKIVEDRALREQQDRELAKARAEDLKRQEQNHAATTIQRIARDKAARQKVAAQQREEKEPHLTRDERRALNAEKLSPNNTSNVTESIALAGNNENQSDQEKRRKKIDRLKRAEFMARIAESRLG